VIEFVLSVNDVWSAFLPCYINIGMNLLRLPYGVFSQSVPWWWGFC